MSAKEKTLLVTLDFPPLFGGVANYYFERVKILSKEEIFVLMNQITDYKLQITNYDFKIYYKSFFTKLLWPHWLPLIWHIYRIVKKEKINKIWVGQVLPVGTAVWGISRLLSFQRSASWRMKSSNFFSRRDPSTSASHCSASVQDDKIRPLAYFVTCHGNDLLRAKNQPRKFKIAKLILRDAEFVEANTEFTKNILINDFQIPAEKIKIVYPVNTLKKEMVDEKKVSELREKYNLIGKKVLLTVGRLVKSKGIDQVICALPKVLEKIPDLVYLIVGDGPDKERLTQIVGEFAGTGYDLSLPTQNNKIIFIGSVLNEELPNYYALANAFILTPRKNYFGDTESFGIVYLEAKEFDLPIVAGNVGGAKEIAKAYNQMHLIDSENIEEVVEKIIAIIK